MPTQAWSMAPGDFLNWNLVRLPPLPTPEIRL